MLQFIEGGSFSDERGTVSFVNDFDFKGVKRFYITRNCKQGFVRAWHGHRREGKYIYVVTGTALVGAVNLETNEALSFVMRAEEPKILCIPPGYANGFKSLTDDTKVMFFSTAALEESQSDTIRFPPERWNIWDVAGEKS